MTGFLLSDDLIFTSRITGTARSLGLTLQVARSSDALLNLVKQSVPSCVLIDLANPGLDVTSLLQQLRGASSVLPRVVAYGSHVDVPALQAAKAAGCDPVLPRSRFVEVLNSDLPTWFGSDAAPTR